MKEQLIKEINSLGITDLKVSDMNEGKGSYVNLQYSLPSGQTVKFWDDEKKYFINQIEKQNSERCYGIVADESYLLVCEYGCEGSNAEIIVYKKRNI